MELGEKLLHARQEAGFSQRQLCGEYITRNMLSQIEHGAARPSMDTLRYLAGRLGKPVSWFLEEDVVTSPNQSVMASARKAFHAGNAEETRAHLQQFQVPDETLEWEWRYLSFMTALAAAEQAARIGKTLYARMILEDAAAIDHGIPELERHRLLMMGKIPGADLLEVAKQLPSLDEELLLRAEAALTAGNTDRAAALLEAAEERNSPKWNLLRGRVLVTQQCYEQAVGHLKQAETYEPKTCWTLLETCFRELGDFRQAYEYACKQR